MNRFNIDVLFTLKPQKGDRGFISNLVTFEALDKIEERIESMTEYKEAREILGKFFRDKNG